MTTRDPGASVVFTHQARSRSLTAACFFGADRAVETPPAAINPAAVNRARRPVCLHSVCMILSLFHLAFRASLRLQTHLHCADTSPAVCAHGAEPGTITAPGKSGSANTQIRAATQVTRPVITVSALKSETDDRRGIVCRGYYRESGQRFSVTTAQR